MSFLIALLLLLEPGPLHEASHLPAQSLQAIPVPVSWDSLAPDERPALGGVASSITCPGSGGGCCKANGTPGCDDVDCCESVCAIDPFCCDTAWNSVCAGEAAELCDACTGTKSVCGRGAGSCCFANNSPGCHEIECCEVVCAIDPFCCETLWDSTCAVEQAELCCLCATSCSLCDGTIYDAYPPSGTVDARQPHELGDPLALQGIGGADEPITMFLGELQAGVECFALCETSEDELAGPNGIASVDHLGFGNYSIVLDRPITANAVTTIAYADGSFVEYISHPANADGDAVAGAADVLQVVDIVNGKPAIHGIYSSDIDHSGAVGGPDVLRVVDLLNGAGGFPPQLLTALPTATDVCPVLGPCPGGGDCCFSNGTPGCEDVECCETVCAIDPFCCDVSWDQLCADDAAELCDGCTRTSVCGPGNGSCEDNNGTPGCDDKECCETVCAVDPFCCDVSWDSICAEVAFDLCACLNGQITGLSECNAVICAMDPFCCDVPWDSTCVAEAAELCQLSTCKTPPCAHGFGDCCEPNDTPGCEKAACCYQVCDVDPSCCDIIWDETCADIANRICNYWCPD